MDAGSVEIRLLGPVDVRREGAPLRVGGARLRALLALLAVNHGRWVAVDELIDEAFRGDETDAAATTLRSYMSRLRATLGRDAGITGGPAGYRLEVSAEAIDAVRFEMLVARGEDGLRRRAHGVASTALREALELWRGRPFGELGEDGALGVEARRLEELRLRALELRLDADLALGAAGELVDELEALVHEHPYREAFWRQLMLALYRAQRQADALAAYHRARTALDEQLGIEPGEELVALEAAILRHEVPNVAPPAERHNLPAAVTTFVGRGAELERVQALVRANRLVTLTGVGGVGKTRLAIEAARGLVPSFADGVAFVDLAPLGDPSLVVDQVTAALDVRDKPSLDPMERLVAHLRGLDLLLVLDNCEHLLAGSAAVAARLLATCPSLRILATSRELLGVEGEADAPIPPLEVPVDGDPAMRDSEAVRLFMARARAARPGLRDDDATIAAVGRICADLEGIPLAIELAAARARVLSPTEIGERLRDRFRFLVSWRRLTAARHRTLREAMDWSHELLAPDAQRLLAELSVFAGGFGLDAVEAVSSAGASGAVLDLVQRLVEASLVTVAQGSERTRYGLLETVRAYGAERLEASGQARDVHRRHAEHFAAVAEATWQAVRASATTNDSMGRLFADRDNFRAALAWSLEHDEPNVAMRITDTLWWYWWVRGEAKEGRAWLERTLAADHRDDAWRRARCSIGLAGLCWSLGDTAAAEGPAEEAVRLADAAGDDVLIANATNTLGLIVMLRGDLARARTLFAESVARYRLGQVPPEVRDRNLATGIDNLGWTAYELGDTEDAMRHYVEARSINEAAGNEEGVAMNDLHLAIVEAADGRHAAARTRLRAALEVYLGLGFLHYEAECLDAAAILANGLGAPAEAAFVLGASARIRADLGNQPVPQVARNREREAATARAALGDAAFEAAYGDGLAAPVASAVGRALAFLEG